MLTAQFWNRRIHLSLFENDDDLAVSKTWSLYRNPTAFRLGESPFAAVRSRPDRRISSSSFKSGLRNTHLSANLPDAGAGFGLFQRKCYLFFGIAGLFHGDLLQGYIQYAGRSLNVNGPVYRDAYKNASIWRVLVENGGVKSQRRIIGSIDF